MLNYRSLAIGIATFVLVGQAAGTFASLTNGASNLGIAPSGSTELALREACDPVNDYSGCRRS